MKKLDIEWIFCCGLYRSGSTLQYNMMSQLVQKLNRGQPLGYLEEGYSINLEQSYGHLSGIKIFKAHKLSDEIHDLICSGKACSVGSYRDIRDVAVSWMEFRNASFSQLMAEKWLESTVDQYHAWEMTPNHLTSKYENIIKIPELEVFRLAAHIGMPCGIELAKKITGDLSMQKQRRRMEAVVQEIKPDGSLDWNYDPILLLHHKHIADGKVNKWKDKLSPDDVRYIEENFSTWLLNRQYALSEFPNPYEERAVENPLAGWWRRIFTMGRQTTAK